MNKFLFALVLILSCSVSISSSYAQTSIKELKSNLKKAKSALDSEPENQELIWNYASINYELGNATKSAEYYKTSSTQFNKLYALIPNNPRVFLATYTANYSLLWSGGTTDITTLQALFSKADIETKKILSPPSTGQFLARIAHPKLYGDDLKSEEERESIYIENLRNGIKEQPDLVTNYQILSKLYANKKQDLLAIAIAKQGLNKEPDNASILNSIGNIYMNQVHRDQCVYNNDKELESAETYFLKAIKAQPKVAQYHTNIAEVYEYQRRKFLMINSSKKAHELEPTIDTHHHLAMLETIYGAKDNAQNLFKEISKKYGSREAKYGKRILAIYQNDFSKAYKLTKVDLYSGIYDYLNKGVFADILKKKRGSAYYAKKSLSQRHITGKQRKLAEFVAGGINFEKLTKNNETSCDDIETDFYYGYKKMLDGDNATAITYFNKVLELDYQSYVEHHLAGYFLNSLTSKN